MSDQKDYPYYVPAKLYAVLADGTRVYLTEDTLRCTASGVMYLPIEAVHRTDLHLFTKGWSYNGMDRYEQRELAVDGTHGQGTIAYWVWNEPAKKEPQDACPKCGRRATFVRTALVCRPCGEFIGGF